MRAPALVIALVLAGAAASVVPAHGQDGAGRAVPQARAQVQLSFAPVVRRAAPAVVNIHTRRVERQRPGFLFDDPFFRRFFGEDVPFRQPPGRSRQSLGSGVLVSPDGTIVTNHHVIKDAEEITVVLADRREVPARVLLSDERTDLAVLKIDVGAERLPHLVLRDSDELEVGDLVLAIGNPFAVGQTVTSGIVSGLARTTVGITDFNFFIQTDAAINPGNSGGALVDMDGRLVGVNTAIFSRSGGSVGIGFAIPANMVRAVIQGAVAGGRVVRPYLGASGQTVTSDIAASLGLARPVGVLLREVDPAGPAAAAGLRVGDIVTHLDGREVQDAEALKYRFATLPPGGQAQVALLRDGRERTATIRLAPPPESVPRDVTTLDGSHPVAGAAVANLSPALAEEIGFDGAPRGVVVLSVRRGSPAARLGIRPGDQILALNGQAVASVAVLRRALELSRGRWDLQVRRGDQVLNAVIGG